MQDCLPDIFKYPSTKSQRKFHPRPHSQGQFLSGETFFYINSHLHIYIMTLPIFEVWVVDRLICQEFSFEEFFSHRTDLAPVYVFLDPQEKRRRWKPPKPWDLESSRRTSSRLMPLLALKKWWGNSIVLL